MKLFAYAILGSFLVCAATNTWAMDRPQNSRIAREVALHGEVASHDEACKALNDNTSSLVARLDSETDAASLQDWLSNLLAGRKDLISALNKTLGSIQKASLADKDAQILMYACFNLLKSVNNIDFGLIESKIAALKGKSAKHRNPIDPEREEALHREKKRQGTTPATFLSLPASIASKAVFHPEVLQVPGFCCGYNVLFNACNFEDWNGFPNCFSDYAVFRELCLGYLRHNAINPLDGVTPKTLDFLLKKGLELRNFCSLGLDDKENRTVKVILFSNTVITVKSGTPEAEIQDMLKATQNSRMSESLDTLKRTLEQSKKPLEIVQFLCGYSTSSGSGHGILISLVQNRTGRGLYVFDNMNAKIDEASPIKRFIDFLCTEFAVSSKNQFVGPYLPSQWPSIPLQ